MSILTMILGESGTGKSTSMRNMDPAKTLLIQSIKKPLPFRSSAWKMRSKANPNGNVIVDDNAARIESYLRRSSHPVVIVDDFQYVLANEFMRRSDERGFDKFTDIGKNAWNVLMAGSQLAENRRIYILSHTSSDETGRVHMKTIGKLLDDKITPEGMVTICLRTQVRDGSFLFATQNNGADTTKSPMGMFDDMFIENDLNAVDAAICEYYGISDTEQDAA